MAEGTSLAGFIDIDPRKIGGVRHGLRIHDGRPGRPLPPTRPFVLAAVGGSGAVVLRTELEARGLVEGIDWLQVAGF